VVLDADVAEHASGPPHGIDGDGGHDRSANKKQDATGLVGAVRCGVGRPSVGPVVPLTAVNVGQTSPPGARGPKGNYPQEAAPRAILVGMVNL
jgi:hypothetical protein